MDPSIVAAAEKERSRAVGGGGFMGMIRGGLSGIQTSIQGFINFFTGG
jgi:hypothetical protein